MFGGQLLAYFAVADFDVLVRNGLPVVADAVINEVAMRVRLIGNIEVFEAFVFFCRNTIRVMSSSSCTSSHVSF